MGKMRIATILVRHGTTKYKSALNDIRSLFISTLSDIDHEIIIADNALPEGYVSSEEGVIVIGAANEVWEFSAWDSAINYLGKRINNFDFIHLATSAFRQLYINYLYRFDSQMLALVQGRAAAVGHIDYYCQPVSLLGIGCQSWLRTSYIFIPPAEIRMLGSFVSVGESDIEFSDNPTQPFMSTSSVSIDYQNNVIGWLTGDGTNQGVEWHSRFLLNKETFPFFKKKALAIFNEQMLSNRLRAQGCALVDATWLSTISKKKMRGSRIAFPPWAIQVSSRDVDAAPANLIVV